jgi:hypothetical protein
MTGKQMIEDNQTWLVSSQHGTKGLKRFEKALNPKSAELMRNQHRRIQIAPAVVDQKDDWGVRLAASHVDPAQMPRSEIALSRSALKIYD